MITTGYCKICTFYFRINGEAAFSDALVNHYKECHPREYNNLLELKKEANEEIKKLREKYKELALVFSHFSIDETNLLLKT